MPADLTSPGVLVQELPGSPPAIDGVATSITAFVGRAARGPTEEPVAIASFGEFERVFGGLWAGSALGFAVRDFFLNGGGQAIVVRLEASDGLALDVTDYVGPGKEAAHEGLFALEKADLVNLLCLPPYLPSGDVDAAVVAAAAAWCERRRAFLLVDPPSAWTSAEAARSGVAGLGTRSPNAALYFPRLRQPDPLEGGAVGTFAPCGAVAGVFARTDATRGVWKAPAGVEATLEGVPSLSVPLTDADTGALNPLAVNALRTLHGAAPAVWGARTLAGADGAGSDWKYVNVRRLFLFLEESVSRGTRWAVFEPDDERLWCRLRLCVGAFLQRLFAQGAFAGATPHEAYFVKCDRETTTPTDVTAGIVRLLVGVAPLRPGEFVVLELQQQAGQAG